jgi:hypothetical protein
MAQSERDRAETAYNEALQSASEVRDCRPGPLVQPSGVTEAMSTLDDEIQILGETNVCVVIGVIFCVCVHVCVVIGVILVHKLSS